MAGKGAKHSAFIKKAHPTADMEHILGPWGNVRGEGYDQGGRSKLPVEGKEAGKDGQPKTDEHYPEN